MCLYSPTIIAAITAAVGTPVSAQISFGLSISAEAAAAEGLTSNECSQDWIEVRNPFELDQIGFWLQLFQSSIREHGGFDEIKI